MKWVIKTVEPYDVLQIEKDGKWLDFSTLRTESEIDHAKSLVSSHGASDWVNRNFRIIRPCPFSIRYENPNPAGGGQ